MALGKWKIKSIVNGAVLAVLCGSCVCLCLIAKKVNDTFGLINPSQLFFHLALPVEQADINGALGQLYRICWLSAIAVLLFIAVFLIIFRIIENFYPQKLPFVLALLYTLTGLGVVLAVDYFNEYIPFVDGIKFYCCESKMFENEFYQPLPGKLRFCKKRNCILIVVESLEETYSITEAVGADRIPGLTELKGENLSFDRRVQCNGTGWTIAALVNIFYGVPQLPLHGSHFANQGNTRRYQVPSIFDYFAAGGYNCTYMQGGHMEFAGKKYLFEDKPQIKVISFDQLCKDGKYVSNAEPFEWGVDDAVLFDNMKKECLLLAEQQKPFFMAALTLNTHGPNGYLHPENKNYSGDFFAEVLRITDKRIIDFVNWVKLQKFAADTTIILVSDHLAMNNSFMDELRRYGGEGVYSNKRRTYNCFINPCMQPQKRTDRLFAAFDLMPTVLHAAVAEWDSDRLHFGVSLFGKAPTVLEKYGIGTYEKESLKRSGKYMQLFSFLP